MTVTVRLRRGRRGRQPPARCEALRPSETGWTPCTGAAECALVGGRAVCAACYALGEAQRAPWAVLPEAGVPAPPQRRRGGKGGAFKPPPAEVAVQNRRRLHALMATTGRIRPVDLAASAQAAETGEAPPWTFAEAAELLRAPGGTVRGSDIGAVWRGQRRISPGWTYQGEPFATWPAAPPLPGAA